MMNPYHPHPIPKFLNGFLILQSLCLITSCVQSIPEQAIYLDPDKPGLTPQVFARNIISMENEYEFGSVFSLKGDELFYGANDKEGKSEIRYTRYIGDSWNDPVTIISDTLYGFNDPFLSPSEKQLFYISKRPRSPSDTIPDFDIWYSERSDTGWSDPINAGMEINSDQDEYYISFASNGTMYFASNRDMEQGRSHDFDIYSSESVNGVFEAPAKLGEAINTRGYEADVFVAPDESYLVFCAARRSGFGQGDLYISFKDSTGNWSPSINLGETINSSNHELCPFVTQDGRYFLYTSDEDIYWVSSEVLHRLNQ